MSEPESRKPKMLDSKIKPENPRPEDLKPKRLQSKPKPDYTKPEDLKHESLKPENFKRIIKIRLPYSRKP